MDQPHDSCNDTDACAVFDERTIGFSIIHNEIVEVFGKEIGPFGAAVYLSLCKYAGKGNSAWPSHNTIAAQWGISVSAVKRSLVDLEKVKLIEIRPRYKTSGGQTSNCYAILTPPKPLQKDDEQTNPPGHTELPLNNIQLKKKRGKERARKICSENTGTKLVGFPIEDKPDAKPDVSELGLKAQKLSQQFHTALVSKRQVPSGANKNLQLWKSDAERFIDQSGFSFQEIQLEMDWYIEHFGEPYVPYATTMEIFCNKFCQIRAARLRARHDESCNGFDIAGSESGVPETKMVRVVGAMTSEEVAAFLEDA